MTFNAKSTAAEVIAGHDLSGREAVVTGGASGLGAETARALASAGARVVIAGRDRTRGEQAAARLSAETAETGGTVVFRHLDLSSLTSVRAWAEAHAAAGRPLHLLVANAGVMAVPLTRTGDGFESQFGTNHLGHFALALGLLPSLRAAGDARVVVLSSRGHRRGDVDFDDPNYLNRPYDPWQAYGQSKSANALFTVGFTGRHASAGITANAVMPGAIMTDLQRHITPESLADMGWADEHGRMRTDMPGWKTPQQGAATSIWAAVAPELAGRGGLYLDDCAIAEPWTTDEAPPYGAYLPRILDPERAERLWELSEKLTAEVVGDVL